MFKLRRVLNQMIQFKGFSISNPSSGINTTPLSFNSFTKPPKFSQITKRPFSNSIQNSSTNKEIIIALGSNIGDRVQNFNLALQLMKNYGIIITKHSCLYETVPAYFTNQPLFLNSAIRGFTKLDPFELLKILKNIEKNLGRTSGGVRYGPRPIDLDILFYDNLKINSETLIIPHERIWERNFVLAPLIDLIGTKIENDTVASWHNFANCEKGLFGIWEKLGGEMLIKNKQGIKRVFPIKNNLFDWSTKTLIMGILNLTPDSFSDGGKFTNIPSQISQFKKLISQGADIIDIGAQSTRPNAKKLTINQELERLVPFLDEITKMPLPDDLILSIDTFYADVALEAVKRGVHLVNDISGGTFDINILNKVSELNVPFVIMHIRGDPCTMQNCENLEYKDLIKDIAFELYEKIKKAELNGVPLWRIIIDPGLGFAKKSEDNLELLSNLEILRGEIEKLSVGAARIPMLIGPSRKRFLGEILERENPLERDLGSVVACTVGILGGANIIRVHNVGFGKDAARVCDALIRHKRVKDE